MCFSSSPSSHSKLLLFVLINFMVFGLKDFILGSVCFLFICVLSCLMGQKKLVWKYIIFYVIVAAIQQLCSYLPQAIETILSVFTLFIRVMIPVVLFASTFIATTKVSELIAAMYTPTELSLPEKSPERKDVPAIEVKELSVGYEKGEAVAHQLNFSVYRGEIVGIVGKNGCGKTTLARTICGLQKELQGEVFFSGETVSYKKRIRKAYLVMQDPDYQLFTDSVYQELKLALSDRKEQDEKMIDDILDELNLSIYKERHPMSLSGGQKQRTAIGVAALRDSEVIIFDEPTSGLDYKNMESVAKILRTLAQRGKAILVISHDNELLMKICSRIIRIEEHTSS